MKIKWQCVKSHGRKFILPMTILQMTPDQKKFTYEIDEVKAMIGVEVFEKVGDLNDADIKLLLLHVEGTTRDRRRERPSRITARSSQRTSVSLSFTQNLILYNTHGQTVKFMPTTSQETLKTLSDAIDAFAAAKMANNESLIRYSIAQIQEFINGHNITPRRRRRNRQPSISQPQSDMSRLRHPKGRR